MRVIFALKKLRKILPKLPPWRTPAINAKFHFIGSLPNLAKSSIKNCLPVTGPAARLNVIHIGKSGGSTVRVEIKKSQLLLEKYNDIFFTHGFKPIYRRSDDYLIVIRNPLSRAISAFNWRYHLVVETEKKKGFKKGEWEVLKKYDTLSNLAESIYSESGHINRSALNEFRLIPHLYEDISFYLSDLLPRLLPAQVYGVIKTHSIQSDCSELLGSGLIGHEKKHGTSDQTGLRNCLTSKARANLKRLMYKDFQCITQMWCMGMLSKSDYNQLID